jgi:VCBS repeat-containing protein
MKKFSKKRRRGAQPRSGQDVNRRNFLRSEQLEPRLALAAAVTAINDAFQTGIDQPLEVGSPGVLMNDIGTEGRALSASLFSGPANGQVEFRPDGSFLYVPNPGFEGQDSFVYSASDGTTNSLLAAVTIQVAGGQAPQAVDDLFTLNEDESLTIPGVAGVLANDGYSQDATVELVSGPESGSLTLDADGGFEYVPAPDMFGNVTFTYRATNSYGTSEATVTLAITPVNDLPVATNDEFSMDEDGTLITTTSVLENDFDPEGATLTPQLESQPLHGTVTFNPDGTFTYQPESNYFGLDGFSYLVSDGQDVSEVATVTITIHPVNDAPVAANDEYTMEEDGVLDVAAGGVLENDSDVDGDSLTATLVAGPQHGTLMLNPDGSFTYTPEPNFSGVDGFSYQAGDGVTVSDVTSVTINVTPTNDPPVAVNDEYTIEEDTQLIVDIPGVLLNDLDPEDGPLTAQLVTPPQHGTVTLDENGGLIYTPEPDFHGVDGFSYTVSDGELTSDVASVTITVTPVNDAPVSSPDAYQVEEDSLLIVATDGLLGNDTDVDSPELTAWLVSGPAHGTVELAADGTFTYIPDPDFHGEDSFTYVASDGELTGDETTVTITVSPVNDKPIAEDDAYTTDENQPLQISAPGVLENDSDVDGDSLTAQIIEQPANGTVTLAEDGSFLYTPNPGFAGIDTFTYAASDGTEAATAVVTITVNDVVQPPLTHGDAYSVAEDTPLEVSTDWGVLANDFDPQGLPMTAEIVTPPEHGQLTLNPDGSFHYVPDANYHGTDGFVYRAVNSQGEVSEGIATIVVEPVNDAPTAGDDFFTVAAGGVVQTTAATGVMANDTDIENGPLTATLLSGPAHGVIEFNADGSFTYTPEPGYFGSDEFFYQLNDGLANSNVARATIAISPAIESPNARPIAVNDAYTLTADTTLAVEASGVLANDIDEQGNALLASLFAGPQHGTVVLNPDGSFTYTPEAGFVGTDSFLYWVSDGNLSSALAAVTLRIEANPESILQPEANADEGLMSLGDESSFDCVLANWA